MPRSLGNVIADSLQLSLGYAERLKDSPVNGTSAPVFRLMSDS
jgi:hypothetical protein